MSLNTQWRLVARPAREVRREHFEVSRVARPTPAAGEALVRNVYLLIPPSMRLWMNEKPTYFPPQPLGEVMMGFPVNPGSYYIVLENTAPPPLLGTVVPVGEQVAQVSYSVEIGERK